MIISVVVPLVDCHVQQLSDGVDTLRETLYPSIRRTIRERAWLTIN